MTADEALLRMLYREHGQAVLAYVTRLTGDVHAAEDVLQETLFRAWRHAHVVFNGKGSVRGWLITVARNIVTDRYRAKAARPVEVTEEPKSPPLKRDHADDVVQAQYVYQALMHLSPEQRVVLAQIYFRGRTAAETAQVLGIPEGTVKSRAYYALRTLRETLGRERALPCQKGAKDRAVKREPSGRGEVRKLPGRATARLSLGGGPRPCYT